MEVAPFFVDFHHFLSIFTIYAILSRFTFCRDLHTFSAKFFLAKIAFSATSHVWIRWEETFIAPGGFPKKSRDVCLILVISVKAIIWELEEGIWYSNTKRYLVVFTGFGVWDLVFWPGHTCKKREIAEIYLRNFFWIFRKILGWEREINTAPKPSPEVAPSKMEVAPF